MKEGLHPANDFTNQLEAYEAAADNYFNSTKAKVEGRLSSHCGVLPSRVVLGRDIVQADDPDALQDAIQSAVDAGYHPGVRTCFAPQIPSSPWVMGIQSKEDVDGFMKNTYPEWVSMRNITELIVMHNPVGLDPRSAELSKRHFVFRLVHNQRSLQMEARLGTTQLRSIEAHTNRADLISVNLNRSVAAFNDLQFRVGGSYTKDGCNDEWRIRQSDFRNGHHQNGHVRQKSLTTIEQAVTRIQDWCADRHLRLGDRLEAFAERGLEISEWQGRFDEDGFIKWMRIYGFRGSKDDTFWG